MPEYLITPATEEERDWAAGLMACTEPWISLKASYESCYQSCHDNEYLLFIAHASGTACGMMLLQRRGVASSPYLKSIAVQDSMRGQGTGSALLNFAENYFRPVSRHFFLCVSSFNIAAIAFYQRHGYSQVGEFRDYIIEGASEILMHKRLK